MKRILIVGTFERIETKRQPVDDLMAFVKTAVGTHMNDASVTFTPLDDLVHVLDGDETKLVLAGSGEDIAGYDFVWLRGRFVLVMNEIATVAEYLERKGANYANHSYAHRSAYGKAAQMHTLAALGLPYPKTVFAAGRHAKQAFMRYLPFPMVVKNNHGSHGEKNYLVHDESALEQALAVNPGVSFVAQACIPNDADYRLLLVGDKQLIIRRQGLAGSHLNNTSQGGTAVRVAEADFPAEIIAEARRFATALHYAMSGVDVLFDKNTGQHYFLEANSQPQIISGACIPEKQQLLADYLRSKLGA